MKLSVTLIFACLTAYTACLGTPIDQSQTQAERENDWMDGTAQSFTAGCDGLLTAIRLPLFRNNGPVSLTLEIRHVDGNEIPTGPVLASGTLPDSAIPAGTTQWHTVTLDTPYAQAKQEKLSFTVQQTATGTPYGWLEYGQSTNNPYPSGLMYYDGFYGPAGWTYDKGLLDFTFQTLAIPKPELSITTTNVGSVSLSIPMS